MPFTLSHPAAVLPFFKMAREPLAMLALVVGCLSPDFGYYTRMFVVATFAHTLLGSMLVCVPVGFGFLGLLILWRNRIAFLLPGRLQIAWSGIFAALPPFRLRPMLILGFWIWVGALTHILWDSFTHRSGWMVLHFPGLADAAFQIGNTEFPRYYLLQQLSTLVGLAIVLGYSVRQLCRLPAHRHPGDSWRLLFWAGMGFIALSMAIPPAYLHARQFDGLLAWRSMLFQTAVFSGTFFLALLGASVIAVGFLPSYRRMQRD